MFRSTRLFARELERRDRLHAQQLDAERAAWREERGQLIGTICTLAGRPLDLGDAADVAEQDEDQAVEYDPLNDPGHPIYAGDGLLTYTPDEE